MVIVSTGPELALLRLDFGITAGQNLSSGLSLPGLTMILMPSRKTVTRQTLIGEQGIALISQRCLEMGFIFHPRRVDHGIDGHIDLVDPASGALLNHVLLVQSKAQNRPFPSETGDGLHYICDQRDLDLWLSGNAPVLLVLSHPSTDEAWWVDVKSAFPDALSRANRTVYVDKRSQAFDKAAAASLLRAAQPRGVGIYLRPPPIKEALISNLMPLVETPPTIYRAPAAADSYPAAGALLAAADQRASAWILRDGQVISFSNLREAPLSLLCAGDVVELPTSTWANSDEKDTQYRFMDLLSRTVQDSYPELRWHKERQHLHFRATPKLTPRKAGKGPGSCGRTFLGLHYAKSDPQRVSYYHHAALRTRYRRLGETWYCQLEPDYCFTFDGSREASFADGLLAGIKRLERHPAVSGWLRAWSNYLTRDPDLFSAPRPVRLGPLLTVQVTSGIDDRWWGPAPSNAMPDEEPTDEGAERGASEAELAMADIDTADLLSLLEEESENDAESKRQRSRRRSKKKRRDASRPPETSEP